MQTWQPNPIIVKELRSRMRGMRAFATLTATLLVLAVFNYAVYQVIMATSRYSYSPVSPQLGQGLFSSLAFLELAIICAITPSVTAGAISGEQEKLTYEMLLNTPLNPASILWGKLVSALSYVILLLFAAVPMASLVFVFGGVTPRDMLKTFIVLICVAVMIGVMGLFFSALFGRSGRATALSYLVVLALLFGPLFVSIGYNIIRQTEPPRWITIPSPISALSSALAPSINPQFFANTFWMVGGSFWNSLIPPISYTSIPRPIYHYSLPLYGFITLVLYLLATRLVRPTRRWQITWSDALIGLILLLGFAGLVTLGFFATTNRYENITLAATATPAMMEPSNFINPTPTPIGAPILEDSAPDFPPTSTPFLDDGYPAP